MKKKETLHIPPVDHPRVLMHGCCAPCSSAMVEWMLQHDIRPTFYYCNPNIFPQEEYLLRKQECERYAHTLGLDFIEAEYIHDSWLCAVKGLEKEAERGGRCMECFKYRLLDSARYALAHGYNVLTTTLASSRWKSLEQIDQAGHWAVEEALKEAGLSNSAPQALIWWEQNWRKDGLQERRNALIKEHNFYNQQWCGCEFSQRK
jgi:predicted adenine nucleotide alpha hydrolase (AANH) superfamily ATPase